MKMEINPFTGNTGNSYLPIDPKVNDISWEITYECIIGLHQVEYLV